MADIEALKKALIAADRAGDKRAAQLFAAEIKKSQMHGPQQQTIEQQTIERQFQKENFPSRLGGVAENVAGFGTGILGDVVSNITALAQASPMAALVNNTLESLGLNVISDEEASKVPNQVARLLTYQPKTNAGKLLQKATAEEFSNVIKDTAVEDVLSWSDAAAEGIRSAVEERTGSKVLANAALAAPELLIDVLPAALPVKGRKGVKKIVDKDIRNAYVESEVDLNEIRKMRDGVYSELDNAGTRLKGGTLSNLIDSIKSNITKQGYDIDLKKARPMFERLEKLTKPVKFKQGQLQATRNEKLGDVERIRQYINKNSPRDEPGLAAAAIGALDDFVDEKLPKNILMAQGATKTAEEAAKTFGVARELAGRVIRTQQIDEMFAKAANDSNPGRVLQRQFKQLLNNPKKRRFYTDAEVQAMREISRGQPSDSKIFKLLGRIGVTPESAMVGTARFLKVFGGAGARRMPLIGSAKRLATGTSKASQAEIVKNARLARNMIAAGKNGTEIINKYLKAVPKGKRDSSQLAKFLSKDDVDLTDIELKGSKLEREAIEIAKGIRFQRAALGTAINKGFDQEEMNDG